MSQRVYTDGVYDLFHRGHLESFKEIKKLHPASKLVVGIISDIDCESYKRKPIINQEDRYEIIKAVCYVDEIIFPAPLVIDAQFIKKNHLDIIVHGFANSKDQENQEQFFRIPKKIGIFREIPYWSKQSTSNIIKTIKNLENL